MAFKIGFAAEFLENKRMESKSAVPEPAAAPRRSMVQVYFAERNMNLAYYNDQFDLHCGDTVYVTASWKVCAAASPRSAIILKSKYPTTSA